ncbi:MAG: glycosyltransferase [Acidimicrobiales bacterium]
MFARIVALEGTVSRVAVLSLHTSPLVQPGLGDAGDERVHPRARVRARPGREPTRPSTSVGGPTISPTSSRSSPGSGSCTSTGPVDLAKEDLPEVVDAYTDTVQSHLHSSPVDVIHANYWLGGCRSRAEAPSRPPLLTTFHTLARVKAETGDREPQRRIDAEIDVIRCADVITANSVTELHELVTHYGADPDRVEVVTPGVDHALFSPGSQAGARDALGLGPGPVLLFVGRIQPLKGADVAVESLAELDDPAARLLIVGGQRCRGRRRGGEGREADRRPGSPRPGRSRAPTTPPHAVDLLPRRRRLSGAVAQRVVRPRRAGSGRLRHARRRLRCRRAPHSGGGGSNRVPHRRSRPGRLRGGDPPHPRFTGARRRVVRHAAAAAASYTWTTMAARLRRVYDDLAVREPIDCMA